MTQSSLEKGIQAAQAGQVESARALLARAVQETPQGAQAWLWLAAVVQDDWQKLFCLRRAIHLDPGNETATRGVEALTAKLQAPPAPSARIRLASQPTAYDESPVDNLELSPIDRDRASDRQRGPGVRLSADFPTAQQIEQPADRETEIHVPRIGGGGTLRALAVFVLQRLLFGAVVLVAVTFLTYLGLDMAGGARFQTAVVRAVTQTGSYLGRLMRGDLGMSIAGSITYTAVPVVQAVSDVLLKSLGLLAVSLFVAIAIGVVLGFWAARRRHTGWSLVTLLISIVGISTPSFFAALLLQLLLIRWTRAFGRPLLPVGGFGWDRRIILPALVLAARPIAQIARMTFVTIGETLDEDYVRTAHSKGLAPRRVMSRHVIRNAAIPILTTVGVSLRFSLSSLPVVEFFFGWTGMGFILLKSIARRDDNLTVALLLCLGALFIGVNVLLEAVYRLIDPRLRERVTQAQRQEREDLLQILDSLFAGLRDGLARLSPARWPPRLARSRTDSAPSPFRAALEQRGLDGSVDAQEYRAERRRSWIRGTVSNLPFVLGALLVAVLLVLFVFGPTLTPHSPYTKRGLEYSDGKLTVPPFAPDEIYLWGTDALGRDMYSLVIAGAQQTLLLTILVVAARLALGIVLGALAGWLNGDWIDRALLGLAEVVAAFPALLLAMTLVLALGIQQGMRPFVIALSLIGWGEIMQFVRGEVMAIRVRPFIESAVSAGLRTPRIVWSHILPNLLSSLISIGALEMGAVLMLLGELGFVGIFIGGGAFAELQIDAPPYHYSDVPEWAALLSNIRLYARSYPWTALYPALAFFSAILGFNLFGEGIRRMVETVGIGFTRLINRYTVAAALIVAVGVGWVKGNTGSMAYYRRQAAAFDGERALVDVLELTDPSLEGRALGSPGQEAAAEWIAGAFRSVGLQPAGEDLGYLQYRDRSYQALDAIPTLAIEGTGDTWSYRVDYAEYPSAYRNLGQSSGPLHVLIMGEQTEVRSTFGSTILKGLVTMDLGGKTILALSEREAFYLDGMGLHSLLVVAGDERDLARRYTLSTRNPTWLMFGTGRQVGQDTPRLRISEHLADQLLEGTGRTVADLRLQAKQLQQDEVIDLPIETVVSMQVEGTVHDKVPARHVIGHLPGVSDSRYGGINAQTIVVLAQYDSPPISPEGTLYPAANDNASGVATMLEVVRAMRESGYEPYRTFLFIAYSGEGLEGGEAVQPSDVRKFLQAKPGFSASLEIETIVHLRGLGAGDGGTLLLSASGSRRLARLFEDSARRMDVRARRAQEAVDLSIVFEEKSRRERGQEAPEMTLTWEGWEAISRTPADAPETLSADKLEQAGETLTLALMILGRELQY
jgi:peptide/nickel transport system permease protein